MTTNTRTPSPRFIRCSGVLDGRINLPRPVTWDDSFKTFYTSHLQTHLEEGDVIYKRVGTIQRVTTEPKALPFEIGKTYKTKDGGELTVVATFLTGSYPLLAVGRFGEDAVGIRSPYRFTEAGEYTKAVESRFNLIPEYAPGESRLELVEDEE